MGSLVLLSGGLDSAVALAWARRRGRAVALTFNYPERPAREIRATRELAEWAGAPLLTVELPWMREATAGHPLRTNPALSAAHEGYVPARNLIFYGIAAHHAELLGLDTIVGGHHVRDGDHFPDASPAFFAALNKLVDGALETAAPRIVAPLHGMDKAGVVRLGVELQVPFQKTWSCYEDAEEPCGKCHSCLERGAAFGAVGCAGDAYKGADGCRDRAPVRVPPGV